MAAKATPSRTQSGDVRVVLVAFAAIYIVWGSTFLAIRWAVESIPPFAMMSLRCLVAGTLLVAMGRMRGTPWPARSEWLSALVVGTLFFVTCHGILAYAEQRVTSGTSALFLATIPLFVPLLVWATRGARPSTRSILGLVVGFAGVIFLVTAAPGGVAPGGLQTRDVAELVFASLSWAGGTVAAARLPLPRSPMMAAGVPLLAGGIVLAVIATASGEFRSLADHSVHTRSLLGLAYMVVFGSILTLTAYLWLLGHVPPTRVATYAFVNPAVAVLLGWGLASEQLTGPMLLATLVIVAGVTIVVSDRRTDPHRSADIAPTSTPVADRAA